MDFVSASGVISVELCESGLFRVQVLRTHVIPLRLQNQQQQIDGNVKEIRLFEESPKDEQQAPKKVGDICISLEFPCNAILVEGVERLDEDMVQSALQHGACAQMTHPQHGKVTLAEYMVLRATQSTSSSSGSSGGNGGNNNNGLSLSASSSSAPNSPTLSSPFASVVCSASSSSSSQASSSLSSASSSDPRVDQVLAILIANGGFANQKVSDDCRYNGDTLLCFACRYGLRKTMRSLRSYLDVDVQQGNAAGETPLLVAASYCLDPVALLDTLEFLINYCNADTQVRSPVTNRNVMETLCAREDDVYESVVFVALSGLSCVNLMVKHRHDEPAVFAVVGSETRHSNAIWRYLNEGGDPNVVSPVKGESLLHALVSAKNFLAIKTLLESNEVQLDVQDLKGYTPFLRAVSLDESMYEVAKLLMARGCDPNLQAQDGTHCTHFLRSARINVLAVWYTRFNVNWNTQNNQGDTALHFAVRIACDPSDRGTRTAFCLLFGADHTIRNAKGQTPLDLCKELMAKQPDNQKEALLAASHHLHEIENSNIGRLFRAVQRNNAEDVIECYRKCSAAELQQTLVDISVYEAAAFYYNSMTALEPHIPDALLDRCLFRAFHVNSVDCIMLLLKRGASLTNYVFDGESAFLGACVSMGEPTALRAVCQWAKEHGKEGFKESLFAHQHETMLVGGLHLAAALGRVEACKVLLEYGFPVDALDNSKETPAVKAAAMGHLEVLALLTEWGANLNIICGSNISLIHIASFKGHLPVAKYLICDKGGPLLNLRDTMGETALLKASVAGHTEIVKMLIEAGSNLDFPNTSNNATPLYCATFNGHTSCALMLVKAGADARIRFKDGTSVLFVALQKGNTDVARAILDSFPEELSYECNNQTPLISCALGGQIEAAAMLLARGVDPNQKEKVFGNNALSNAVAKGQIVFVKWIISRGADVNLVNNIGDSPLQFAESTNQVQIVEYLRSIGATKTTREKGRDVVQQVASWLLPSWGLKKK